MNVNPVVAILLAAGNSSRMGQPKQQLLIDGEPLLRRMVLELVQSKVDSTVVVLGSDAEIHKKLIEDLPVEVIIHNQWSNGMGSSLKKGLNHCKEMYKNLDAVLIAVCDQPRLTAEHINNLLQTYHHTSKPVVASSYSGTMGVPALLNKKNFESIGHLNDGQGAKKLILENSQETTAVDFAEGAIDLDTPDDYRTFLHNRQD